MRSFIVLLPVLAAGMVAGQRCSNGLPGLEKSGVCCDSGCGTCGGSGCRRRGDGLTAEDCCTSAIKENGPLCSVSNAAPCVVDGEILRPTPSPFYFASVAPTTTTTPTPVTDSGPTCSNGVPGFEGTNDRGISACCPVECNQCGGGGCVTSGAEAGLDNFSCCVNGVVASSAPCSETGSAPCVVDVEVVPAPTPSPAGAGTAAPTATASSPGTPAPAGTSAPSGTSAPAGTSAPGGDVFFTCDGILKGAICCSAGCGECGGVGCSARGNGLTGDDCCTGNIRDNGTLCSVSGSAPCIVDVEVGPAPTPAPSGAGTVAPTVTTSSPASTTSPAGATSAPGGDVFFTCDGILKGAICCSAGCGECGGVGCSARGNGLTGDDCCTGNIRDNGTLCSVSGSAPCIVDVEVGPAPTPAPSGAGTVAPTVTTSSPASTSSPAGATSAPAGGVFFTCDGILKDDVCCSAGCGECGGVGCSTRGDGLTGDDCCLANIRGSGPLCSVSGKAPCNVDVEVGPAPTPSPSGVGTATPSTTASPAVVTVAPVATLAPAAATNSPASTSAPTGTRAPTSTGEVFTCDGVLGGDFCCTAGCGTCGGSGCSSRGNGLTGEDCCTSKITQLCSETMAAPCIVDDPGPPPGPTVIPEDYVPADCSLETTISIGPDKSFFSGGGCATLTDMYNVQTGDGPLWVLDSSNKTVDGAGGSATPTGRWLLTSGIEVLDNVRLEFKGLDRGGDCDVLKIQSTPTEFWEVRGHGGSLYFEGTSVTSWDTSVDPPTERQYTTGVGRSYLNCVTQYDNSDIYSCDGRSNKNRGTCRMDLIDSTFGNLGWDDSESYGLTWKVRGLCKDLSNLEIFDKYNVYGDILNSDIYGMYYGMYSYGHQGGVWTNNKMHDNIQYGFDPHDDSDDLTIADNVVYNNGNHGIIASKRCNNVKIYNNEVSEGGANAAGIFLHRSSDNAEVYNNKIYNMQDAGIAWMESFGGKIYDNSIQNCKYGIRLSLGSADNEITNNVFDTISQYGLYTYQGSDTPDVPGNDGRPKDNTFDGNTIINNEIATKIKRGDNNIFKNNVFTDVKQFEFPESTGTVWIDNSIGDGCIEQDDLDDLDVAEGSDPIPVC